MWGFEVFVVGLIVLLRQFLPQGLEVAIQNDDIGVLLVNERISAAFLKPGLSVRVLTLVEGTDENPIGRFLSDVATWNAGMYVERDGSSIPSENLRYHFAGSDAGRHEGMRDRVTVWPVLRDPGAFKTRRFIRPGARQQETAAGNLVCVYSAIILLTLLGGTSST